MYFKCTTDPAYSFLLLIPMVYCTFLINALLFALSSDRYSHCIGNVSGFRLVKILLYSPTQKTIEETDAVVSFSHSVPCLAVSCHRVRLDFPAIKRPDPAFLVPAVFCSLLHQSHRLLASPVPIPPTEIGSTVTWKDLGERIVQVCFQME